MFETKLVAGEGPIGDRIVESEDQFGIDMRNCISICIYNTNIYLILPNGAYSH